jgi:predicted RNase H-like HicB family nuclease
MIPHYSLLIQWSEIDQIFVVTIPEFIDRVMMPCTEGKTYEEAARSGQEVIETFLEIWEEEGRSFPEVQVWRTDSEIAQSAAIIQERHEKFLKDGIEFDAKEALENLRDELIPNH